MRNLTLFAFGVWGLVVLSLVLLVMTYFWWIFGGIVALAALREGRRIVERRP